MRCLLRPTRLLRQPLTVPCTATRTVTVSLPRRRSFTRTFSAKSTAGYGDADQTGDDPSNKPDRQGSRSRNDTEHPGREPVSEGKGAGSGGYAETGSKRKGKNQGGPEEHKDVSGSGLGGKTVSDMENPTPDEGEKEAVDKHNREMDQRYDHKEGEDEKVGKGFWSGESGSGN